jgi:hypothetical protein
MQPLVRIALDGGDIIAKASYAGIEASEALGEVDHETIFHLRDSGRRRWHSRLLQTRWCTVCRRIATRRLGKTGSSGAV